MVFVLTGDRNFKATSEIIREIHSGSDRAAAIVGASLIENQLEERMLRSLHPTEALCKELFHPSGPLGAFGSKIRLAQLVGFISETVARDIQLIAKIRNRFAHDMELRSFDEEPVSSFARELALCETLTVEARQDSAPEKDKEKSGIGIIDREENLKSSRGRFTVGIAAVSYALSLAERPQIPGPRI